MNLIVGATGHLGGLILHRLLDRGEAVRALVRPGSPHQALAPAELAVGDLKDAVTLSPACKGVRRIIATATAAARAGEDTVEAVDRQGYRNLIDAAEAAGVEELVFVSAHGFEQDSPVALARAKATTEELLRQSSLSYTILRPVLFMEAWIGLVLGSQLDSGPKVRIIGDPDRPYGFVAAENVADLALAVLGHPEAQRVVIPLGAAVASYRQIVEQIGAAVDEEIEIEAVAPGQAVPGLPPIVNELWSFAATGGMEPLETPGVAKRFGLSLIDLGEYISDTFGPPSAA